MLSDNLPILKVSIFLALLSASRVSEITNLRMDYLTNHLSVYTFAVTHLAKTCQMGKKPHLNPKFYNFPGDSKFCVCKAIHFCLERRNVCRIRESKFRVSHIKPHKPVYSSVVSKWLGQGLAMAGIDMAIPYLSCLNFYFTKFCKSFLQTWWWWLLAQKLVFKQRKYI